MKKIALILILISLSFMWAFGWHLQPSQEESSPDLTREEEQTEKTQDPPKNEDSFEDSFEEEPCLKKPSPDEHREEESKSPKDSDLIQEDKYRAYLTFDDGPSKIVTPQILDVLRKHSVKATFFVNGPRENSSEYDSIYKRIFKEGHTLGNHGYTHDFSYTYGSKEQFIENVERLDIFLQMNIGVKTRLFRFQGGSANISHEKYLHDTDMKDLYQTVEEMGYTYFDWNVSSADTAISTPSADDTVENVLKGTSGKEDALILLHDTDSKKNHPEAVERIIVKLKNQGYVFHALSEYSYNYQQRRP